MRQCSGYAGLAAVLCFAYSMGAWVASAAAPSREPITDRETRLWWHITTDLSGDEMEGRDTGSPAHARAAAYVQARFEAAGLRPAGEAGFRQTLALHEVQVDSARTRISVIRATGEKSALRFLHEISVHAEASLPAALDAPLAFRGYCSRAEMTGDLRGRVVLCFGSLRQGMPSARERIEAAVAAGAIAVMVVDDPGFTIEPPRWPVAYARTVTFAGEGSADNAARVPYLRLNASVLGTVIEGSGRSAEQILEAGAAQRPLPSFEVPARLVAEFSVTQRDYGSDNVLGLLPGTDPRVGHEVVVASAHLDGYGYGEAVHGDALYNGTLDDAAYVATLIRLAEQRHGRGYRRSVLFAAFTGEEKGLLGATYFTRHPTVAREDLAADLNLDQLRPLFPLKILTMHALDETSLGTTAREVAGRLGIEIRADREPERHLNQRADHWPFLKIGVPATGFVFGYDPGTDAERRYREWYEVRYHRPQDDPTQPMDFQAAADFNRFFYEFAAAVADAAKRPAFLQLRPQTKM